jgi:hypothetical protein
VEYVNPYRQNASLQTLRLQLNQIGDVGAAAIGESLRCVHDHFARHDFLIFVSLFLFGSYSRQLIGSLKFGRVGV